MQRRAAPPTCCKTMLDMFVHKEINVLVQWWVGTVRFYDVQKGWISMQNAPILATLL
jgi:hypothetical protein